MTTTKITKKDNFMELRGLMENIGNTRLVEFIDHEIELLEKKNKTKTKKVSESQTEVYEKVLQVLTDEPDRLFTATEIARTLDFEYSTNKISPQLKKMVESEIVTKSVEKRVSYFKLA